MKKFLKGLLITAACFAGLGVVLTVWGISWSLRVADRLLPDPAVAQQYVVDSSALEELRVRAGLSEVRFEAAPAEQARVEAAGFAEGELTIEQQGGVLTVQSRSGSLFNYSLLDLGLFRVDWLGRIHTGSLEQRVITFYLPELTLRRLELESGAGLIRSDLPLVVDHAFLSCGAGEVRLSSLIADELTVERGAGSVALSDFTCQDFSLTGGTGEVRLTDGSALRSASLEIGVGQVVVNGGTWHDLKVQGGVGELDFTGRMTGDGTIEAGVGSTLLTLLDPASAYSVEIQKGLGSVQVTGAELTVQDGGARYAIHPGADAENSLVIHMGVGEVRLHFPEE